MYALEEKTRPPTPTAILGDGYVLSPFGVSLSAAVGACVPGGRGTWSRRDSPLCFPFGWFAPPSPFVRPSALAVPLPPPSGRATSAEVAISIAIKYDGGGKVMFCVVWGWLCP